MAANAGETKVKLWEGICYPENMLDEVGDMRGARRELDGREAPARPLDKKFKRELGWR